MSAWLWCRKSWGWMGSRSGGADGSTWVCADPDGPAVVLLGLIPGLVSRGLAVLPAVSANVKFSSVALPSVTWTLRTVVGSYL